MHVAKRQDAHVELQRIGVAREHAANVPAIEQSADRLEERRRRARDDVRLAQVLAAQQVLVAEERDEFRVVAEMRHREIDETAHAGNRVEVLERKPALGQPQLAEHALERGDVELLLAAEVVVDHPHVAAGAARDLVDARADVAVAAEFGGARAQHAIARRGRIALARRVAVRLWSTGKLSRHLAALARHGFDGAIGGVRHWLLMADAAPPAHGSPSCGRA